VDTPESPAAPWPTVLAVVVAHDPGDWFDDTLRALEHQDYPDLRLLVIDTGTGGELAERVASVQPEATVHRINGTSGYGAAANEVFDRHTGADYLLFCHDDAAPDQGAVRAMVEAAALCGAAVVGPKLVRWDDPHRLLQLGAAVDQTGQSVPLVEPDELDQGQHDGCREVFQVPAAFTLVRTDLFRRIGGFDEAISFLADDLSLGWRAQLAGARVVVTSEARVRHRQELDNRLPAAKRRRLLARHRLRVVLTSSSWFTLLRLLPQLVLVSLVEVLVGLVTVQPARVRTAAGAWLWNLLHLRSLHLARKQVRRLRRVGDGAVRRLQVRRRLVQPLQLVHGLGASARNLAVRDRFDTLATRCTGGGVVVLLVLAAVLVMGSRHLLTRGVPAVGELAPLGRPDALLEEWLSGWRRIGLGSETAAPTALGAFGLVGWLVGGHMELLRTVAILGLIPLGLWGAVRLLRPTGSARAPVAAAVAYAVVPVPYNALAAGRWAPLAVYAACPWLLGCLARASGTAPYRGAPWAANALGLGLVTGALAILVPGAALVTLLLAGGLVLGSLLGLDWRMSLRLAGATGVGLAVAAVLQLPWSLDLLRTWRQAGAWIGTDGTRVDQLGLVDLLAFDAPTRFSVPLAVGLVVAAGLPVLVGRSWRLAWAVRAWTLAATAWTLGWLIHREALGGPRPDLDILLGVAGAALAFAVGLGVAAVERDVVGRSRRFGYRRTVTALACGGLLTAILPIVHDALDGYWQMPRGDFSSVLGFLEDDLGSSSSRVLWLGDPDVLPASGWILEGGTTTTDDTGPHPVAFATTEGLAQVLDLWAGPIDETTARIGHALELATSHQTTRLGRLLAPMAIEYVAVPQRLAPSPFTAAVHPAEAGLVEALAGQLDLERVELDPAVVLYRNAASLPGRGAVEGAAWSGPGDTGPGDDVGLRSVLEDEEGYETPTSRHVKLGIQGAAWLVVVLLASWLRRRASTRQNHDDAADSDDRARGEQVPAVQRGPRPAVVESVTVVGPSRAEVDESAEPEHEPLPVGATDADSDGRPEASDEDEDEPDESVRVLVAGAPADSGAGR
jgi:GT2 family glycosyltransferase